MAYQYDLFISYRRDDETRSWIEAHLLPLLRTHVGNELGRKLTHYLDVQQEATGAAWPAVLGHALADSRALLVLWTKWYRASPWCANELAHMVERQMAAGLASAANPVGLVVPVFIHDGKTFPNELGHLQPMDLVQCFSSRMVPNSDLAQRLEQAIKAKAEKIADCINAAPPWQAGWAAQAAGQMFATLHESQAPQQSDLVGFTRG